MRPRSIVSRLFRDFLKGRSGAGAVEFAMVAPVLLILILGGSELGVGLTVDRKVKGAAGAMGDLASQSMKLESSDFSKLMGIARGIVAPYSYAPLDMRLTQIEITEDGIGRVDWSCPTTGYPKQMKGTPVPIPPEFSATARTLIQQMIAKNAAMHAATTPAPSIFVIRGEAKYSFTPVTGEIFGSAVELSGVTYVQPRYSEKIESLSGGCTPFSLS